MKAVRFMSMSFTVLVGGLLVVPSAISQTTNAVSRVGVFDSRCVAIAYGRSASFAESLNELRSELKKAKEEGNEARVKEIERIGPTSQVIMHQQGFSTGSVRNIMDKIRDKIPAIAEKRDVRLVVSKWEIFHTAGQVELIDVTDDLVSLFSPNAETLRILEEVKKMEPVPIEQISMDPRG